MTMYKVCFSVPETMLGTIFGVLKDEGITVVSMEPIPESERKNHRYAGGRRAKGIGSEELVLQTLDKGPVTRQRMKEIFAENGYAATTETPTVTKMIREGSVIQVGEQIKIAYGKGKAAAASVDRSKT